ncbi:hypothetical protein ACI68E_002085 [Malassezia pachydermatis]
MEDASWHRVETLVAPEGEGWTLEEDTSELIVLDLSQTANTSHVDLTLAPGTDGMDTRAPILKVGDTVMLGQWDDMIGSEIVLASPAPTPTSDGSSASAPSRLGPIAPGTGEEPTGASSTSTRRVAFAPARPRAETESGEHVTTLLAADLAASIDEEDMPLSTKPVWAS